jgi:hypothetical protein
MKMAMGFALTGLTSLMTPTPCAAWGAHRVSRIQEGPTRLELGWVFLLASRIMETSNPNP